MIGIPTITEYGSSYGSYQGAKLSDYKEPEPKTSDLNNKDMKETGEYKPFSQNIKDFILARLGFPTVKVELTDFQIQTCIEESISKLDYHAPLWMTQFAVFSTSANINVYELPPHIANNLVDVVFRSALFTLGATPGSLEYDFALMFFGNVGLFNNFKVSEFVIMQMYLKQIRKYLSQETTWNVINNKYLQIYPVPDNNDGVILQFRGIDIETMHPLYKNWVQRYSLCVAKEILGQVRSKFKTIPGPGGGSQLNGEILLLQAEKEKEKLIEELTSEIENPSLFDVG